MKYRIASFNLCNLNYQSNSDIKKSFEKIAEIIKNEKFDIVALQEILSESALKQLKSFLGANWESRFTVPETDSKDHRGEGYAYIWNSKHIRLVNTKKNGTTKIREPQIWHQYPKTDGKMIREPYYARFSPKGLLVSANFEIRLINTHIIWGNCVADRQREYKILVQNIYQNIADRIYGDNTPAYTIILGDYNLDFNQLNKLCDNASDDGCVIVDSKRVNRDSEKKVLTVQSELTTLKPVYTDEYGNCLCDGYSNSYDHFSYDSDYREQNYLDHKKVYAPEKYYGKDGESFAKYHKEISDHVPICIEVDLRGGR